MTIDTLLEPGSTKVVTFEAMVQLSTAISLRRIADNMEKMTTEAVNEYGEPFHAAIAGSVSRALREFNSDLYQNLSGLSSRHR